MHATWQPSLGLAQGQRCPIAGSSSWRPATRRSRSGQAGISDCTILALGWPGGSAQAPGQPALTCSGPAKRPRLGPKRAIAKKAVLGVGPWRRAFFEDETKPAHFRVGPRHMTKEKISLPANLEIVHLANAQRGHLCYARAKRDRSLFSCCSERPIAWGTAHA